VVRGGHSPRWAAVLEIIIIIIIIIGAIMYGTNEQCHGPYTFSSFSVCMFRISGTSMLNLGHFFI
jgi:hypothetical protein